MSLTRENARKPCFFKHRQCPNCPIIAEHIDQFQKVDPFHELQWEKGHLSHIFCNEQGPSPKAMIPMIERPLKSAGLEPHKGSIFCRCHLPTLACDVPHVIHMCFFMAIFQVLGLSIFQDGSVPNRFELTQSPISPPSVVHLQRCMRGMLGQFHVIGCLEGTPSGQAPHQPGH